MLILCIMRFPLSYEAKSTKMSQVANAAVVDKVLSAISDSEISTLVQGLTPEACDVLMKYVYRSMGNASNCSLMLKLHSQLTEKAGLGCIVRTMAERKTV